MPTTKLVGSKAVASADKLFRRERQVMAFAAALATEISALRRVSISFVAKKSSVKSLLYLSPLKEEEPVHEEEGDEEDDDAAGTPAAAPASASAEREQPSAPPLATPSKTSKQARSSGSTASAPKRVLSGASSGGTKKVDKNALSARAGSPKGSQKQLDADDPMLGAGDSTKAGGSSSPPVQRFKAWAEPMFKVKTGPPPAGLTEHGTWRKAQAAGIDYGDPARMVWFRNSDGRAWEADDGDQLRGLRDGVRTTPRRGGV